MEQLIANGIIYGSIIALAAIGLSLAYRILNFANFAHGDFSMLGAYCAIYFITLLSGWTGWLGSLIVATAGVGKRGMTDGKDQTTPLRTFALTGENQDFNVFNASFTSSPARQKATAAIPCARTAKNGGV